jgi:hypothetical protein
VAYFEVYLSRIFEKRQRNTKIAPVQHMFEPGITGIWSKRHSVAIPGVNTNVTASATCAMQGQIMMASESK